MKIMTTGNKLEITEAIDSYVDKKINGLDKFFPGIIAATVTLGLETHHHQKGEIFYAECKMEVPGADLFAKEQAKDIYAAIDILRDHLEAELKKYKQKLRGNEKMKKVISRQNKEYRTDLPEVEG